MARTAVLREPDLPWADYKEDRIFRWLSVLFLVLFMVGGIILNSVKLPEVQQKNLVDVSPRLAKLILEKQKVPPPPKEIPKPEKKKPKKKEKKKEPVKKTAREVAQQSGLIAMSDELEDLRESFELNDLIEKPQSKAGKQAVEIASNNDLVVASAGQSSGGIQADTLNRKITTSELAQRKTTQVESKIDTESPAASKQATTSKKQGATESRSANEIERVFQQYKGSIFNIYNRALRNNPSLAGKVVVELTIAPDGSVTTARILSSELGDAKLERKLVLKIKRFKFSSLNVAEITVTYPIDFLPS